MAYIAFAAALVFPIVQFERATIRNLRKAEVFDRNHPDWTSAVAAAGGPRRPKQHKGAIGRWCKAVKPFWKGVNIYQQRPGPIGPDGHKQPALHPNMPFVVILLTPLAYMPTEAMALTWSLLKLGAIVAAIFMTAEIAGHKGKRIPDWILALGLLWSILMITDDMLHGNTNAFVLAAVAGHVWLFRRGKDIYAGAVLALAICLKMTPAIFLLYWLYQRNWRLLTAAMTALMLMAVAVPLAVLGPGHYLILAKTWLANLIIPGLVKGAAYPIHINQSIPGVLSRYFMPKGHPDGNIFWNPDDNPYQSQDQFGWITICSLSPAMVKALMRGCQVLVVALGAWAIGWRKLARDDARRALHYGTVILAMLMLNQRTWEHHGPVTLVATVAIWQAIAFGCMPRRVRLCSLILVLVGGSVFWLTKSDAVVAMARAFGHSKSHAGIVADQVEAYGPMLFWLGAVFLATVASSVVLRRKECPYADTRQRLGAQTDG